MKGSWGSGKQRSLESCLCLLAFHIASCQGYHFINPVVVDIILSTHAPLPMVSTVTWLPDPASRAMGSGASWLNVAGAEGVGGKVQGLSAR